MQIFWQKWAPSRLDPEGRAVFKLDCTVFWAPICKRKHSDFRVAYTRDQKSMAIFLQKLVLALMPSLNQVHRNREFL